MDPGAQLDVLRKLQVGLWAATGRTEPEARWVGKKPQRQGAQDRREALVSDYVLDVEITDYSDSRVECTMLESDEEDNLKAWTESVAEQLGIDREAVRERPPGAFDVASAGVVWVCAQKWRSVPDMWAGEPLRARVRLEARVVPCAWMPQGRQLAVLATEVLVLGVAGDSSCGHS